MSFINWGSEDPVQRAIRQRMEEEALFEQAVRMRAARLVGAGGSVPILGTATLTLVFNDIMNADSLVGDSANVDDWNIFLDLPNYGGEFTSVVVEGNTVTLTGVGGITIKEWSGFTYTDYLVQVSGDAIVSLEVGALAGCTSLISVSLAELTTAKEYCLAECSSLTTVDLPKVLTLGYNVFAYDVSLNSVNLQSCTSLGDNIYYNGVFEDIVGADIVLTVSPTVLTNNNGLPDYDIFNVVLNNNVTINEGYEITVTGNTGDLVLEWSNISYANQLVGDATVVGNWNNFFNHKSFSTPFTSVDVTGNIVTLSGGENIAIQAGLFESETNLTRVTDLGCVFYIDNYSFNGCSSLAEISFSNVNCLGYWIFRNCSSLTTINLPQLIFTSYGSFQSCTSLVSINLPELLMSDGAVFSNCTNLTTVSLPKVVTTGAGCFYNCTSLTTISLPELIFAGYGLFQSCTSLTTVSLPKVLTADSCFYGCTSLTTINLPELVNVNLSCFGGCTSLTAVSLPKLVNSGTSCFYGCTSLTSVSLPELASLGNFSFTGCTSLTSVNLPKLQYLGQSVSDNLVFLAITGNTISLTIPSSLMTCNGGNPDGDIQYLQANNTVTVTQV